MRAYQLLTTFAFLSAVTAAVIKPRAALDGWVAAETTVALAGVLANIGPASSSGGAASGIVIASPSTSNPDYLFTWTRDSALVTKALLERLVATGNTSLLTTLQNYAAAQVIVQKISSPSGSYSTGGLGEPKFYVDETAFTGAWGRPQRDGPALRATTLIGLYNYFTAHPSAGSAPASLAGAISADLNYVVTYWNQTGFDLWEEVQGSSFFTIAVSYRALVEGYKLTSNATYLSTASQVLCFLGDFWSSSKGYVVSNINVQSSRTGLDANSILATNHIFDSSATTCDSVTFQPCSDKALANHKAVVDSFRSIYTINGGIAKSAAVAVGRYPEDSYYSGNPWYLNTLAAAEQLYDALYTWNLAGSLNVTTVSLPFFTSLVSGTAIGSYSKTSATFLSLTAAVKVYADGFVAIVEKYTPSSGALAEQFDRATGTPLSARDLTWSYASVLTVSAARAGTVPSAWASGATSPACRASSTSSVTFNEIATTTYGENVFIVGSIPALGSWSTSSAVALSAAQYTSANHLWTVTSSLPAGTTFEYKFIRKESDGSIVYESDPNRSLTTGASGTSQTVNSTWR